jgi:hypothetical protein
MLTNILREDKVMTMGGIRSRGRNKERGIHRCREKRGKGFRDRGWRVVGREGQSAEGREEWIERDREVGR